MNMLYSSNFSVLLRERGWPNGLTSHYLYPVLNKCPKVFLADFDPVLFRPYLAWEAEITGLWHEAGHKSTEKLKTII